MFCESNSNLYLNMSKPSKAIINGLLRLHFSHLLRVNSSSKSKPSLSSAFYSHFSSKGSSNFTTSASHIHCAKLPSKSTSANLGLAQILSNSPKPNGKISRGFRFVSFKSELGQKLNGNLTKKVFEKPASVVSSTFSRYREAIGLQIDAFFKRNYLFLFGAGGVVVCMLLWRIMFGIANTFVGISVGMAKYEFLALSTAIVAFAVSSASQCPIHFFLSGLLDFLCILNLYLLCTERLVIDGKDNFGLGVSLFKLHLLAN